MAPTKLILTVNPYCYFHRYKHPCNRHMSWPTCVSFLAGSNFCKQIPSQREGSFSGNSLAILRHPRGRGLAAKGQQHSHNTASGSRVRTLASGWLSFESWPNPLLASQLTSLGLSYSSSKMGILRQSRVARRLKLDKYGKYLA